MEPEIEYPIPVIWIRSFSQQEEENYRKLLWWSSVFSNDNKRTIVGSSCSRRCKIGSNYSQQFLCHHVILIITIVPIVIRIRAADKNNRDPFWVEMGHRPTVTFTQNVCVVSLLCCKPDKLRSNVPGLHTYVPGTVKHWRLFCLNKIYGVKL